MKVGRKIKKIIDGKVECSNCKRVLVVSNFRKNKYHKFGYQSFCKDCEQFMERKKKKGGNLIMKEFGEWLKAQKQRCVYCDITLEKIQEINDNSILWGHCFRLTYDRKDSSKGYDKENIVLACFRCNRIKSDLFTFKEMKTIGKIIKKKNQH